MDSLADKYNMNRINKMIFEVTADDWWQEFVFWRKVGKHRIAFDYIRVHHQDLEYMQILFAMIIKRKKYGTIVRPGDIIRLGDIDVVWTQEVDKEFRRYKRPELFMIHVSEKGA
jgi:hypothetical protein